MAALILVFGITQAALGHTEEPADSAQQELAAGERVALARARVELLEQLEQVPLTQSLGVVGWAARRESLERALRRWVLERPPHGPTRRYSNGDCEVDLRVEPHALAEVLVRLHREFSSEDSASPDQAELRRAAEGWPILWATGRAERGVGSGESAPAGWEDLAEAQLELARRAAAADARLALLREAARLKVTNARLLGEFLEVSPEITAAVREGLEDITRVRVVLRSDRVATAEARLRLADLIELLVEVHRRYYRGDTFTAAIFFDMPLLVLQDELNAYGLAAPPPAERDHSDSAASLDSPDSGSSDSADALARAWSFWSPAWAELSLRTTGVSGGWAGAEPSEPAAAHAPMMGPAGLIRAALPDAVSEAMARRAGRARLRALVELLPVAPGWTVGQLAEQRARLRADLEIFLNAARQRRPSERLGPGVVAVELDLPLRQLWRLVCASGPAPEPRSEPPRLLELTQPPATQPGTDNPPVPTTLPADELTGPQEEELYG